MKNIVCGLFIAPFFTIVAASLTAQVQHLPELPGHPRLLFQSNEEHQVLAHVSGNHNLRELHRVILEASDEMIPLEPVTYEKTGRRLLPVSRTCLKRVLYLSYSYRLTNEVKYLQRAVKEMLAAAEFTDWNPDHFLDVSEMTTALAIGYDWLYKDLGDPVRTTVKEAIIQKGLLPSKNVNYNKWLGNTSNWNQVCNGGLSLGALAIYESEPDLAREILERALNSLELPCGEYEPDGAYPEGSTYWAYGTMFHLLFIDALRTSFPQELAVETGQGFMKSGNYFLHVFGPTGSFNYSDCRTDMEFTPALFWYAVELNDPSALYHQYGLLNELNRTKTFMAGRTSNDRFLPLIPIWSSRMESMERVTPVEKSWTGGGKNPVSFHRTSWEDQGIFIGIKGGSPSLSHAHMDAGSFVMDADGVRWAMDLGKHDYNILESAGMDIWNRGQSSDRWKVFRHSNFSHNTLVVNDGLQNAEGNGIIVKNNLSDQFRSTVVDITSNYAGQLKSARRGIAIVENDHVIIRDELLNTSVAGKVRWAMLTHDSIQITDGQNAVIHKDQKELRFKILEPAEAIIQNYSTKPGLTIEEGNPGTTLIGFEIRMEANEEKTFVIALIPGNAEVPEEFYSGSLSDW